MSNQIFPLLEAFNRHLNNALHILNSGAFIINRLPRKKKNEKKKKKIKKQTIKKKNKNQYIC